MKKKFPVKKELIIGIIIVALIALVVYFSNVLLFNVHISNSQAKIVYSYDEKNINEDLTKQESDKIYKIFDNSPLAYDSPSCGFTDSVSIKYGFDTFEIACDDCGIVKYKNKYFNVSDTQIEEIHKIMVAHGAHFPCV